jgi:hypothetical protein
MTAPLNVLKGTVMHANRYYETIELWTDSSNSITITLRNEEDSIAISEIINKHIPLSTHSTSEDYTF